MKGEPGGRPRVLLLHGYLSSNSAWNRLRAELPEVETIAPDLPGWGTAGHSRVDATLQGALDALSPLVEQLRPTAVIGHSMGGIVALALAQRFAGSFLRVGVVGVPVFTCRTEGLRYLHRRGLLHRVLLHQDRVSHAGCTALWNTRRVWRPLARVIAPRQPIEHVTAAFWHSLEGHRDSLSDIVFAGVVPGLASGLDTPVVALQVAATHPHQ